MFGVILLICLSLYFIAKGQNPYPIIVKEDTTGEAAIPEATVDEITLETTTVWDVWLIVQ